MPGAGVVPQGDVAQLSGAVLQAMQSRDCTRQIGCAARRAVERDYGPAAVGDRLEQTYFSAISAEAA